MVRMTRRAAWLMAVALTAILAGAGSAGAQAPEPRIIGGSAVPITDHPWQVAVLVDVGGGFSQFCGGAILDELHVVTAGHCTDLGGGLLDPSEVRVLAGNAEWPVIAPDEQYVGVTAVSPIASYVPDFDNDAAILTLDTSLTFGAANVKPVVLTGSAPGEVVAPGTSLIVSGWGATNPDGSGSSDLLRAVQVKAMSDATCATFFSPGDITAANMLCASDVGRDSCAGDSGGPLTRLDGTLVGLVSFGPDPCADVGGAPGVYTELANATINAQVRFAGYDPPALQGGSAVTLTGSPREGEPLTCDPGSWTDGPAFDYRFEDGTGALLRSWGSSPVFTPGAAAVGRQVVCVARARAASGAGASRSAPSAAVAPSGAPPALSIGDVSVTEGDAGTTAAVFTVSLSGPGSTTITADYASADGSATAPGDYVPVAGTLTFAAGEVSKTVEVLVNGDTIDEPDETFTVGLVGATNATISGDTGVGTIRDDDDTPPDPPAPPAPPPANPPPANPAPKPPAPAVPPAATGSSGAFRATDAVRLPSNRSCLHRPALVRLAYRKPKGATVDRVEVWIGTKRLARRSGNSARRSFNVRGLPSKRFTLTIKVTTRDGQTVTTRRTYAVCSARALKVTTAYRLTSRRSCLRRPARVSLAYRRPRGVTVDRIEVWLGRKRLTRRSGSRARRSFSVRGLPARKFKLTVKVKTRAGRTVTTRRTYRVCAR